MKKTITTNDRIWLRGGADIQVENEGKLRNGSIRKGIWVTPVNDTEVSVTTRRGLVIQNLVFVGLMVAIIGGFGWWLANPPSDSLAGRLQQCEALGGNTVKQVFSPLGNKTVCVHKTEQETEILTFN